MSDSSSVSSSPSQPSRPRRWQCFLGCGQRYMKSSGRSIRRHVLLCYRRQFASECKGVSDSQIHDLLVSQEEKGTIHTGLKRWRLRRSRRLAMDLPPHERWDCPNRCGRYFRSTSSRSIAKHKVSCRFSTRAEHEQLQVQSSGATSVHSPNMQPSFASVRSPTTTSSSSSSCSSLSSSSSPHTQSGPPPHFGAPIDVADSPISSSQSVLSTPLVSSGKPSESHSIDRLNITLRLSEPMTPTSAASAVFTATTAAATGSVIRPIPRLHASLPLVPPATSSAFLTVSTADKQLLPPRMKPLLNPISDAMSSLLAHPAPSAFRPLYTNTAASYSNPSLPSTLFNLSPLHALASVGQGYVLCSFPTQQLQVPVIGWPY